jgi:peptidoglycan-N-acetylglucosamine deacetylase
LNPWAIGVTAAAVTATGAAVWGAVGASAELFGPTVRHTMTSRALALTFDDGPNPAITAPLLDLLERYSVRATFFLIGRFAEACPDLVRETAARGHVLGNHTHTHANLIFQSPARIRDELARCQNAVVAATHSAQPQWMRPPFGYRSPLLDREVHRAGMRGVVMWSMLCQDWEPQPPDRLIGKLSRAAATGRPRGDIIVLHDGDHRALGADRRHVAAALEHWLPRWRDTGVEFVTMDSFEPAAAQAAH